MAYRQSRNIEASVIDYLNAELVLANWTNVTVEKSFARVYDIELPVVCVRISDTIHNLVEVGSNSTQRVPVILIDIFGKDDGNRLDLKDFVVEKIKKGCPYYQYTINNGQVQTKTQSGRITVLSLRDTLVNLNVDKADLDIHDRYRTTITMTVSLGKVEV